MAIITSDLAQKIRKPLAEGLRGVSGRFPPGQHCRVTRYMDVPLQGFSLLCKKNEILWQLFEFDTISKFKKEYFLRKLYEEIRYFYSYVIILPFLISILKTDSKKSI